MLSPKRALRTVGYANCLVTLGRWNCHTHVTDSETDSPRVGRGQSSDGSLAAVWRSWGLPRGSDDTWRGHLGPPVWAPQLLPGITTDPRTPFWGELAAANCREETTAVVARVDRVQSGYPQEEVGAGHLQALCGFSSPQKGRCPAQPGALF